MGGSYPDPFTTLVTEIQNLVNGEIMAFTADGRAIFRGLAIIMIVWWGVLIALESSNGGGGFSPDKFAKLLLFLTTAYAICNFYSTPIPGLGYSFTDIVRKQTRWMSEAIGNETAKDVLDKIAIMEMQLGNPNPFDFHGTLCYFTVFITLAVVQAAVFIVVGYGFASQAIIFLVGPILVPFIIVPHLDFIFWGWFRAFLQYSFYQVIAQAFIYVFGKVLLRVLTIDMGGLAPAEYMYRLPVYLAFAGMMIYALFKVDRLAGEIFSGGSGSSGGSSGMATQAIAWAARSDGR